MVKMKTLRVEYYRLWENNTWDTAFCDLPYETDEEQIVETLNEYLAQSAPDFKYRTPIIYGVYSYEYINDEE